MTSTVALSGSRVNGMLAERRNPGATADRVRLSRMADTYEPPCIEERTDIAQALIGNVVSLNADSGPS